MVKFIQKHRIKIFLLLSSIIHLITLSSSTIKNLLFLELKARKKPAIEVILIPQEKEKLQIVDRVKNPNKKEPVESKYLSNKNNMVKEESKAPTSRYKEDKVSDANKAKNKEKSQKTENILNDDAGLPGLSELKVKPEYIEKNARLLRIPESTDYLPDVLEKDRTALNTREFVYFSYYERIKKRVGMFWAPALEKNFRKLYFANITVDDRDIITKLIIVLDDQGKIKKIEKLSGSGFSELDDAAVEAFTRAAPFSNPPQGILDEDSNVILKWDFILKSSHSESIRFALSRL